MRGNLELGGGDNRDHNGLSKKREGVLRRTDGYLIIIQFFFY